MFTTWAECRRSGMAKSLHGLSLLRKTGAARPGALQRGTAVMPVPAPPPEYPAGDAPLDSPPEPDDPPLPALSWDDPPDAVWPSPPRCAASTRSLSRGCTRV